MNILLIFLKPDAEPELSTAFFPSEFIASFSGEVFLWSSKGISVVFWALESQNEDKQMNNAHWIRNSNESHQ